MRIITGRYSLSHQLRRAASHHGRNGVMLERGQTCVGARGIHGDGQILLGVDECSVEVEDQQANVGGQKIHFIGIELESTMADLAPFAALRYDAARVGGLERVITQPYDKISPAMLERYHQLCPYNLSRVVKNTDYAAAAANIAGWKREGVLQRDPSPAFYPYFQSYIDPATGEKRTRQALVGALKLEDYSAGVVY